MSHVALELARKLHTAAIRIHSAVGEELHGSSIPPRTIDAPVSGGGTSDPTGSRALYGCSEKENDPANFGAVGGNRTLSLTIPKLRELLDKAERTLEMLDPPDAVDDEGEQTGEKSCRICGCCRAVEPRRKPTRCAACGRFRRRENRDRNRQEVIEHHERMWAKERDRAEQRRTG